jgi:two-component system LytT family response regulator
MMRALIVDDEPLARQQIRTFLEQADWLECVGEAADGIEAKELIDLLRPDVIFLDINMPRMGGLELLPQLTSPPVIVFTTAYDEHALQAFELGAVDYLCKPFGQERFMRALERARPTIFARAHGTAEGHALSAAHPLPQPVQVPLQRFLVRDRGSIVPVRVADVVRFQGDRDYTEVHTTQRQHLVYLSMSDFMKVLDPQIFVRVHRSHIINLDFVQAMRPYDPHRLQITMSDGTSIVASRASSQTLRQSVL